VRLKLAGVEGLKILVIEDEADVRELMILHLRRQGFVASGVDNGELGLEQLGGQAVDLLVLDWMLPGVSGLEICKKMAGRVPVLMVTARAETGDVLCGLEAGADDYIVKPFEIPVFLARVNALLRRAKNKSTTTAERMRVGQLAIDFAKHEVFVCDKQIQLTASEFKLLGALMSQRGRVISRSQLTSLVQGDDVNVVSRTIDTHVFGLRKKLGECADLIETIRGIGYRVKDSELSNHV
jgi:DNA-binding response OmpR family regulator